MYPSSIILEGLAT